MKFFNKSDQMLFTKFVKDWRINVEKLTGHPLDLDIGRFTSGAPGGKYDSLYQQYEKQTKFQYKDEMRLK